MLKQVPYNINNFHSERYISYNYPIGMYLFIIIALGSLHVSKWNKHIGNQNTAAVGRMTQVIATNVKNFLHSSKTPKILF